MAVRIFGVRIPGRQPKEPESPPAAPRRSFWTLPGGYGFSYTQGGQPVSLEQALLNSASYSCIDVLVDHIAAAPLDAIRYINGGRQPVEPPPPLLANPSGISTPDVWRTQMAFSLVTDGNAFGQIVGYQRGLPSQIEWLAASSVTDRKVDGGVKLVTISNRRHACWPAGDILHIPGRMIADDSPFALSPIAYANAAIGTSLSATDYTAAWFRGGGHPSVDITVEGLDGEDEARRQKAAYMAMVRTGEPYVHGDAVTLKPTQEQPDTTAIAIMQQAAIMACQVFHVPPTWIYVAVNGQNVTYANVAQADISGLKDSVDPYYRRIEGALTPLLPRPQIVRVNRDAVLKMDAVTRWQVYTMALAAKGQSVNEQRKLEDEPPWDDPIYDEPGLPSPAPPEPQPMAAPAPPPTMQPSVNGGGKGA